MLGSRRNIFLVGLMAVGKTTVGRCLAAELGMRFLDTDQVIEERAGADISWIFDVEGELGFRDREEHVVEDLTQLSGIVLATGGGVVLRPENRRNLASRGIVIYLDTSIDRLVQRTRHDKRRPLLRGGNREALERLARERAPLYEDVADYRFNADRRSAKALAREISAVLQKDEIVNG
ncbi:MAG: shikimate kinase AroK [Gammaproteobacteria bacterium]|nr:MAG: shikimate kinase AroK [Gammaproteobacteria bacterium]TDJ40670.1 MAG: shikimate kinase AroK [Gammaproteobacteria bacterium]